MAEWIPFLPLGMGALILLLGIPLMLKKIKPNYLYGFRTKKTLNDKNIWYTANAFAGRVMIIIGFLTTVLSFVFLLLLRKQTFPLSKDATALILTGLLLIPVIALVVVSLIKLKKL